MSDYRGPTGIRIHDPAGDTLREETRWTIIESEGATAEGGQGEDCGGGDCYETGDLR